MKDARRIDLSDARTDFSGIQLEKDDIAVIAVPSFGGRVPALATQRLSSIHGDQARCALVCVYGNRAYEDTLIELNDTAVQCGFRVTAAVAAVAEHSIAHQYAAGRPDEQDKTVLHAFAEKIKEKLENSPETVSAPEIPGNRPYKKAGGGGLIPKADSDCTLCGLCAESCPAQAISKENPKETDNSKYISCMRCVAQCPQSARKVNSIMVSAVALALKKKPAPCGKNQNCIFDLVFHGQRSGRHTACSLTITEVHSHYNRPRELPQRRSPGDGFFTQALLKVS